MKILWFTWKDMEHPFAGGAEVVGETIRENLVRDGHEVIVLTADFGNPTDSNHKSDIYRNGVRIIRLGNQWSVYYRAYQYYKEHLHEWPDLVIDESNALPFFARFYVTQRSIYFIHQLARKVWFYQMFFPIHILGYLLEPIYVWMMRKSDTITVSKSTKNDLLRFGFEESRIHILSQSIRMKPIRSLEEVRKFEDPTLLYLGTIRPMKRPHEVIKAFYMLKKDIPNLKLIVAGMSVGRYGKKIEKMVKNSEYKDSIVYLGKVSEERKRELMENSHIICVTSIKEGWGLIVTEAASQGTPAVVYNVDGLRDSVQHNITGLVTEQNTPTHLATQIKKMLDDTTVYNRLQTAAYRYACSLTVEHMYETFKKHAGLSN
jgi:glycosyltransferase involved in cell wall biosynthesis